MVSITVERRPQCSYTMLAFVLYFLCITLIILFIGFYQKSTNALCMSKIRLEGKTALVTGGTAGMGLEIAKDFAKRGAKVIIACPFDEEGKSAEQYIKDKSHNENVVFKELNLASFKSVRQFAADLLESEDKLNILVNNAGIGPFTIPPTEDGLDMTMQVNYFGHFLLTILLMPLIKNASSSRIVNVSSVLHYLGKPVIPLDKKTKFIKPYSMSKFCVIPFSRELTKRLRGTGIIVNSTDPGAVGTNIFDCLPYGLGTILRIFFKFSFKTAFEGAQSTIYAAVDESVEGVSGELFKNCQLIRGTSSAYDDKLRSIVWEESVRIVKLSDEEIDFCFR